MTTGSLDVPSCRLSFTESITLERGYQPPQQLQLLNKENHRNSDIDDDHRYKEFSSEAPSPTNAAATAVTTAKMLIVDEQASNNDNSPTSSNSSSNTQPLQNHSLQLQHSSSTSMQYLSQLESSGNINNQRVVVGYSSDSRDNTNSSSTTLTTTAMNLGGSSLSSSLTTNTHNHLHLQRTSSASTLLPPSSQQHRVHNPLPPATRSNSLPGISPTAAAAATAPVHSLRPSSSQQQQQIPSSTSSAAVATSTSTIKDGDEVWIEERRKKFDPSGSDIGYTLHHYIRGKLLGKGGFAKVYLCTAVDTNKHYAVKVVPKANLVKARARQKLQAEIKIHRMLKHKHVCEFKHFFEDRENCYILLELCHNQSMNEMIKRRKRLTEPEAAYYMSQLLLAVQYMHDNNVIHRDLKLGNLFLDKQLHIKVGDLGLATRVDDKDEKRKTICGTPNYIAPEIIQTDKSKRGHSFEVDVWSMGVILYTVLVGKPPYEAKNVKATYQRILKNEYSFPSHIEVSSHAKDLIVHMLQSDPSQRPSLEQIAAHPFLVSTSTPVALPTSVLHFAPKWTFVNDQVELLSDQLLAGSNHASSSLPRKPALPRPSSSTSRQPFGYRDVNSSNKPSADKPLSSSTAARLPKPSIDMERVVRSAMAMSGVSSTTPTTTSSTNTPSSSTGKLSSLAALKSVYSCGFKIFDEGSSTPASTKPPPAQSRSTTSSSTSSSSSHLTAQDEASLVRKTKALSLYSAPASDTASRRDEFETSKGSNGKPQRSTQMAPYSSFGSSPSSNSAVVDGAILQNMMSRIDTVLDVTSSRKGAYRSQLPRPVPPSYGPSKWVSRYVDYTSKYGLGFLLNDGSTGVYFNDSTKAVLEKDGDLFQYMERKKVDTDPLSTDRTSTSPTWNSNTVTTETYTLSSYPDALNKKVTLLKHFRNYLLEQHKVDGANVVTSPKSDGSIPSSTTTQAASTTNLVYVKKWVRTRHAILFRMSDQTVQVVFFDQSEILLTPDDRYLTYVDKNRKRTTYPFTDELIGTSSELETRLRYTKEILKNLVRR